MEFNFWSGNRMQELWEMVGMLLKGISPGIMISVAFAAVGLLITIIASAWRSSSKEDDDEKDYEYREY